MEQIKSMKTLNILHLGIGKVGKEVVRQIQDQKEKIEKEMDISLMYSGKFTSNNSKDEIERTITSIRLPFVLIDTTSSNETFPYIALSLKQGGFAVLANKRPLAGSQENFDMLHKLGNNRLFYECVVGAGLPIIRTLKDLIMTGDKVFEIKGCFSGTLGFICSELEKENTFSDAIRSAKENGFTENDPREDLSGADVARKVLILARILGRKLEPHNINVTPLYPFSLSSYSINEFIKHVSDLDKKYRLKMNKAKKENKTLRFVASVGTSASLRTPLNIRLEEVDASSPIGSLKGPDNIVVIKTKRYFETPLIIQGAGAGPIVTAAGVFADILQVARMV